MKVHAGPVSTTSNPADPRFDVLEQILDRATQTLSLITASSSGSLEVGAPGGDRMLSRAETARLCGYSLDTLDRLRARGQGPPWVQLSPRRIGFRLSGVRKHIADREARGDTSA
jgi:predicted DNA-binding transcriptional regulator AlpA